MPKGRAPHPVQKEWVSLMKQEARFRKKRISASPSPLELALSEKIPEKIAPQSEEMSPAQNPHTPHHAITLHYRITSLHYTIALRHCITPLRHNTRSTRSTAYTLGRRYKPISSPNSSARHPWATLCHFFVAETHALIPS